MTSCPLTVGYRATLGPRRPLVARRHDHMMARASRSAGPSPAPSPATRPRPSAEIAILPVSRGDFFIFNTFLN